MGLVYKICVRCWRAYPGLEMCPTPECAEKRTSPWYHRDQLDGELHVARTMLAEGNTEADWAAEVRRLQQELSQYAAHLGAAAFKQ